MLHQRLSCTVTLLCVVALACAIDDSRGQGTPAKDLSGDPLPHGALARLGTTRWRHGGVTGFVAFLPDGKSVVSASEDQVFHVWEYPSGKEIRRFGPRANAAAPSPGPGPNLVNGF